MTAANPVDVAQINARTRLERTAWDAHCAGHLWFVHDTQPGRILPSALGNGSGISPCERYCIHGDPLHRWCPDCARDHEAVTG